MALLTVDELLVFAAGIALTYCCALAIYRLHLHPLAKFPGPKVAALTGLYEIYYDIVKQGHFMWEIQEMHKRYGPIVRINPEELHIDDIDYYDELYGSATRKRDKFQDWVTVGNIPLSAFATVGHEHHRIRRGALNPFFSKKAVTELEFLIQKKIQQLAGRFEEASKSRQVIGLNVAYMALTMDIISSYSFARDDDYVAEDDFKLDWKLTIDGAIKTVHLSRKFPFIFGMMNSLPPSWLERLVPNMKLLIRWRQSLQDWIVPILNEAGTDSDIKRAPRTSIFHALRDSDLPPSEKSLPRLIDEGQSLTAGGSEVTANTLAAITFYLLQDKKNLVKLREELKREMPSPTSAAKWSALEQLPFFSAVISEGLRLYCGVTSRLPRIATNEVLKYKEWEIPFGTPVSESHYFMLRNPAQFPNPESFLPERWLLKNGEYDRALSNKYLICFGRGPRSCIGINLAYAELYLTLATICRRFDMELVETGLEDVALAHDFLAGSAKLGSKGVRVLITKQWDE